jgi:flavin-dependent dehydrogenase
MEDAERPYSPSTSSPDFDAVIVGASLAGCTAAILLGRAGLRVALVEKQPDPQAFKRVCTHFIQPSALPTLERLGLLDPIMAAGAVRSRVKYWTRWGWIEAPPDRAEPRVNLRREVLDPIVRGAAVETPGVEAMLGRTAQRLLEEGGAVRGVAVREPSGRETELRGRVTIGADGRDSGVAELAGLTGRTLRHGRFFYSGYFEGPPPVPGTDDALSWLMDPLWASALPTDGGLVHYMAMPTKDRLPEFKRDPAKALVSFIADVPDPPPILESRLAGPVVGKLEMPNRVRGPVAPGLALIGDAALASDPLPGIGCGWALQSGEWLADSVAPALRGEEPLRRGLARYRRLHGRELRGHAALIHYYSTGRRFDPVMRLVFATATRDAEAALAFDRVAMRSAKPGRAFARSFPHGLIANARHALGGGRRAASEREPVVGAGE